MLLKEIHSEEDTRLARLILNTFRISRNAGPFSLEDVSSRIQNGVLTNVETSTLSAESKSVKFVVPVDKVKTISLSKCQIQDYDSWPEANRVYLYKTQIADGLGKYVASKIGEIETDDCLMQMSEFEEILGSGKLFSIKQGECCMTYWGVDYDITFDNWDTGKVFTDAFELQDYLVSNDYWQKFFYK